MGESLKVLGLDVGTTSAATFDGVHGKPQCSTLPGKMPLDDDFGPLFTKFSGWLRDLIAFQRPALIGAEAPWISLGNKDEDKGRPTSIAIVYMLLGMTAVAETVANAHGIPFRKCQISTVRKAFTGSGRAKKQDVERRCFLLGWSPRNLHESDSCAVYAYLKMQADRAFILPPPGMLFASARVTA